MRKLKVLIIPSWYPNKKDPLWGNYFIKQAEALNEYADVSMLYINRVGLKELKNLNKEKLSDGYDDTLYSFKFYKKTIVNYKSVSLDYSYKKYAKSAYFAYKKLELLTDKPDIILVESALPGGMAAKYIKEKTGIPYIIHEHSENILNTPIYLKYVNEIFENANNYMAVNSKISDCICKKTKNKCNIVPNFIDTKKFDKKRTRKDKKFVLLNVCNFYKVKALEVLLKALQIVINKGHTNIILKIVGTGEYKEYYESVAHGLNLDKNVEFVGYVPNNSLPEVICNSDLLCVSSTFETFCIPIVEALSSGIPVLTTDCVGPKEIVNKNNGVIVSINDINAYADAIIEISKNYKRYDKKELKKYAYENYDKSVICKKIINICWETINSK